MANTAYAFIPVANGRVDATNSATLTIDLDTNVGKYVAAFAHGAQNDLHFSWYMPPNYLSGSPTMRIRWRCTASNAGNVAWQLSYVQAVSTGSSLTTGQTNVTGTTAVAGTSGDVVETTFTMSASPTADRGVAFKITRLGAGGADTCTSTVELLDISIEYACDGTIQKAYVWIPAQAFALPASSGAVLGSVSENSDMNPYTVNLRHAFTDYADVDVCLPASYNGTLLATTWFATGSSGNFVFRQDMARAPVGAASDPALSTGTQFTITGGGAALNDIDAARAVVISPSANDTVILRFQRLGSDASDTATAVAQLVGVMLAFNVTTRNPAWVICDPLVGAQSSTTVQKDDDTNTSKWVTVLQQGLDSHQDFIARVPSFWAAGGTLRVRWRANSSSTNNIFARVDVGYVAVGALADPALTAGTSTAYPNAGTNLINEIVVPISTGAAASDEAFIRFTRFGTNGSDTLAANIEILDARFEFNLA